MSLNADTPVQNASAGEQRGTVPAPTDPASQTVLRMYCRNVINTDKSGLASGLARVKQIAERYSWIPRNEWGDYDYNHRNVETLQKEVGWLIEEIVSVAEQSLKESGERVNVNVREVENALTEIWQQEARR